MINVESITPKGFVKTKSISSNNFKIKLLKLDSKKFAITLAFVEIRAMFYNQNPYIISKISFKYKTYWIDCPSCFDQSLSSMDAIMFTHFHFLGASNQHREHFSSSVWIHDADSRFKLCRGFTFDKTFLSHFKESGIEAYHIDGHTPGFTCYFFDDVFFVCDYVFYGLREIMFNPFGPRSRTVEGGFRIRELLRERDINKVCGVDYVADFKEWLEEFDRLLK